MNGKRCLTAPSLSAIPGLRAGARKAKAQSATVGTFPSSAGSLSRTLFWDGQSRRAFREGPAADSNS